MICNLRSKGGMDHLTFFAWNDCDNTDLLFPNSVRFVE